MKLPRRLRYLEQPTESVFPDRAELSEGQRNVRDALLETVEAQLAADDPPEARSAYDRLIAEGYSESDAKKFIANALSREIYQVMKTKQPYEHQHYADLLNGLPDNAYDDE